MSGNPAIELASTLQTAHVVHNPDPHHDANPSTTASKKAPVRFRSSSSLDIDHDSTTSPLQSHHDASTGDEIPLSALEPAPRQTHFPPIPDLRFEQTYLARIKDCKSWWGVAWTTFIDQLIYPLAQGVAWNLALSGWRAWNTGAKFHGQSVGARLRRWWWTTNNWNIPREGATHPHMAGADGRRR